VLSAARLPVGVVGLVSANYRWLWAMGAFWAVTAVVALWPHGRRAEARGAAIFAGAAMVMGVAGVPATYQNAEPYQDTHRLDVSRELTAQLEPLERRDTGPILVDRSNSPFGEPFTYAVVAELQSMGIDFRFTNPDEKYRFGSDRLPQGDERYEMTFAYGDDAAVVPDGRERVAMTTGLDDAQHAELETLERQVADALARSGLRVDLPAARALADRDFPTLAAVVAGRPVQQTRLFHELEAVDDLGLVTGTPEQRDQLARFLELVDLRLTGSVAVYLAPFG
jgi:hypothetical protein